MTSLSNEANPSSILANNRLTCPLGQNLINVNLSRSLYPHLASVAYDTSTNDMYFGSVYSAEIGGVRNLWLPMGGTGNTNVLYVSSSGSDVGLPPSRGGIMTPFQTVTYALNAITTALLPPTVTNPYTIVLLSSQVTDNVVSLQPYVNLEGQTCGTILQCTSVILSTSGIWAANPNGKVYIQDLTINGVVDLDYSLVQAALLSEEIEDVPIKEPDFISVKNDTQVIANPRLSEETPTPKAETPTPKVETPTPKVETPSLVNDVYVPPEKFTPIERYVSVENDTQIIVNPLVKNAAQFLSVNNDTQIVPNDYRPVLQPVLSIEKSTPQEEEVPIEIPLPRPSLLALFKGVNIAGSPFFQFNNTILNGNFTLSSPGSSITPSFNVYGSSFYGTFTINNIVNVYAYDTFFDGMSTFTDTTNIYIYNSILVAAFDVNTATLLKISDSNFDSNVTLSTVTNDYVSDCIISGTLSVTSNGTLFINNSFINGNTTLSDITNIQSHDNSYNSEVLFEATIYSSHFNSFGDQIETYEQNASAFQAISTFQASNFSSTPSLTGGLSLMELDTVTAADHLPTLFDGAIVTLTSRAYNMGYLPGNPLEWVVPPTTIQQALDRLGTAVVALQDGAPIE